MENNSVATCLFLEALDFTLTSSEVVNIVVVSVLTLILAVIATVSNSMALYVFYKTSRLRTLSNTFLISLCITDLLTGVMVQPFFVLRHLHELNPIYDSCTIRLIYVFFASLCAGASLLTLGLVTIDRYVAITMPYRYLHIASCKLYVKLTFMIWLFWTMFVLLPFIKVLSTMQYNMGLSVIYLLVILLVFVSYWRIYHIVVEQRRKIAAVTFLTIQPTVIREGAGSILVARKSMDIERLAPGHRTNVKEAEPFEFSSFTTGNHGEKIFKDARKSESENNLQIMAREGCCDEDHCSTNLQTESRKDAAILQMSSSSPPKMNYLSKVCRRKTTQRLRNFINEQRQTNTFAIIIATLILCYLLQIVLLQIRANYGDSRGLLNADAWADLLVFLNSCLNPLIYCHRNRDMQLAFKSLFKKP